MDNLLPHKNLSLEDMDGEIWKDIEGFEGYYQISNFGRVKSLSRIVIDSKRNIKEKILKVRITKYGYINITISFNRKQYSFIIHRLVDNPKNKREVNHINSIKLNNSDKNLEWTSSLENECHKNILRKENLTSKYIGVSLSKNLGKKWRSQIKINQKSIHLGMFNTEEEAYQARCEYEKNNNIENKYL